MKAAQLSAQAAVLVDRSREDTSQSPLDDVSSSFAQQVFVTPQSDPNIDLGPRIPPIPSLTRRGSEDSNDGEGIEPKSLGPEENIPSLKEESFGSYISSKSLDHPEPDLGIGEFPDLDAEDLDFMPELDSTFPFFLDDNFDDNFELDIEEITRLPTTPPDYDNWALTLASQPETLKPPGSTSFIPGPYTYLYQQPSFREGSEEMLCMRFDKLTCGILSVGNVFCGYVTSLSNIYVAQRWAAREPLAHTGMADGTAVSCSSSCRQGNDGLSLFSRCPLFATSRPRT